jgi:hypothetical protein
LRAEGFRREKEVISKTKGKECTPQPGKPMTVQILVISEPKGRSREEKKEYLR